MDNPNNINIFARIGGIDALHDIVDHFYDHVLADTTVTEFFKDANMDIQRGKMKAFLMMALGGPVKFTGKDMRKAHTHLVSSGLSDRHFDAIKHHLDTSLAEFGVDDLVRNEVSRVMETVRADVLNK
jgi:hemoglobin